jgi:predicted dehydrogenase
MKQITWGILSTARIGVNKVIPALQRSQFGRVVALASRDLEKGRATAAQLGIPVVHGSYEALLADPSVDAIYNPLPNHLHVPWSIKALEAGKHVLCEKPIAVTTGEAQQLVEAAARHPKLKAMEAFMYRFHPQWVAAQRLIAEGKIGELRTVDSHFSYFNVDPQNIRNRADVGGGALMDIGCYCISFARLLFGTEPQRVLGHIDRDPQFQTDRVASGVLEFTRGTATFTCATQLSPYQRANIFGTEGRIEIEIPVNAPPDRPTRFWLQRGNEIVEQTFAACDQYTLQADAFARAILDDTAVPTPLTDAVANLRVIELLVESARRSAWM